MNTPKAGYIPAATLCLALTPFAGAAQAQSADPATSRLQVTQIADGLEEPWALDFLPDGRFLVTERDGMLFLYSADGSARNAVSGLPEIVTPGQGGLLDVMVTRDFANTSRIWLSYAAPASGGAGTSAGFGTLSADGIALQGFRQVIDPVGRGGGRHFGSRLVEAADGTVFVTTGERGNPPLAQETGGPEGKVLAFDAGGTPKTASEFSGQSGVWPGLYSYGHRNIQGAALDATGRLVTVEHGAQGGDEVNIPQPGRNYGWPVISYGRDYDGSKIGEGQSKPGMEQPAKYWDPSIAPSGLMIYQGDMFPDWRGDYFIGSLKFDLISRLDADADFAETRIELPQTARVRDVVEAPDGAIWFLSVGDGAIYRISAP